MQRLAGCHTDSEGPCFHRRHAASIPRSVHVLTTERTWRVRGARPGKPGRQTAGASSRTPKGRPMLMPPPGPWRLRFHGDISIEDKNGTFPARHDRSCVQGLRGRRGRKYSISRPETQKSNGADTRAGCHPTLGNGALGSGAAVVRIDALLESRDRVIGKANCIRARRWRWCRCFSTSINCASSRLA